MRTTNVTIAEKEQLIVREGDDECTIKVTIIPSLRAKMLPLKDVFLKMLQAKKMSYFRIKHWKSIGVMK